MNQTIEIASTTPIVPALEDKERDKVTDLLNHVLADEYGLFTKTLNYHWNIVSPRFRSLHELFEDQYKALLEIMDDVAERVRILDQYPLSTVKELRTEMTVSETPGKHPDASMMLADLRSTHGGIIGRIEEGLKMGSVFEKDPGTEDFLVGLLRQHQMMSWTLKSHLNQ